MIRQLGALAAIVACLSPTSLALEHWFHKSMSVTCSEVAGSGTRAFNILIVGESWADRGRLFPELPRSASLGRKTRACAIAFSGRQTDRIRAEFRQIPASRLGEMFGGAPIDRALILNGVNDVAADVGGRKYASDTVGLAKDLRGLASRVAIVSVPDFRRPRRAWSTRIRVWLQGRSQEIGEYRAALARSDRVDQIIDYRRFLGSYDENRRSFTPDGVHLTGSEFHRYGGFVGGQIARDR